MEIRVPQLAEGVTGGTVVSIAVKVGDTVKKDQTVLDLESNKAVASITAPAEGKVAQILVSEGAQVTVGQVLISLAVAGSDSVPAVPQQVPAAPEASKIPLPKAMKSVAPPQPGQTLSGFESYQYQSAAGVPPPASPTVRKMALELGIDLGRVQGSEAGGRINLQDLRNYISNLQQVVFSDPSREAKVKDIQEKKTSSIDFSKFGPVTKKPMTSLRKTISAAMVNSWTTIPHVTQFDDLDISLVMKLRKSFEADYEKAGAKLTLTPFIIKAAVAALKKYPVLNSSMDETTNEVVTKDYYHIGIAVDTEHGLMVPVIRDADKKSLLEISRELEKLAEKTRTRKIAIEEMQGGTFTISNQGGIGGKHFTPIINKPEVAILGVGRGYLAPGANKTGVSTTTLMPIGLSYDHRLIDGGSAARFVVALAEALKSFSENEVELVKTKSKKGK